MDLSLAAIDEKIGRICDGIVKSVEEPSRTEDEGGNGRLFGWPRSDEDMAALGDSKSESGDD